MTVSRQGRTGVGDILAALILYLVFVQYVLPRLGVPT